jgi:hypothetical protein
MYEKDIGDAHILSFSHSMRIKVRNPFRPVTILLFHISAEQIKNEVFFIKEFAKRISGEISCLRNTKELPHESLRGTAPNRLTNRLLLIAYFL